MTLPRNRWHALGAIASGALTFNGATASGEAGAGRTAGARGLSRRSGIRLKQHIACSIAKSKSNSVTAEVGGKVTVKFAAQEHRRQGPVGGGLRRPQEGHPGIHALLPVVSR